jgi:putative tricarboxylic transport membrane protein
MKNLYDQLSALFWLAVSIGVCAEAIPNDIGTVSAPGSRFFPFWSGVIIGILSIILLVTPILKKRGIEADINFWEGSNWGKVIGVIASLLIYAILLDTLGYLIVTFGFMLYMFGIVTKTKLWVRVVSAGLTVAASYIIFYIWLGVQLPKGIFGL